MKKTLQVAGTELRLLFYSPIAWFLLIVFLFQAALTFIGKIEILQQSQQLGGHLSFITSSLMADNFTGLLPQILSKLYLYIPLLTMGLLSREINNGTIKLLYSSPIKIREIIFGKFLAMVLYSLCLVFLLFLFVIITIGTVPNWDGGLIFSGLLGIFLLLCTYSAIGLFMSCLTSYQVVAAVSTFVIFAVLAYIGTVWQSIDFVRDLTYFLSISGRTEQMISGLISSDDVLYFIIIISIFLSFSIYKLQGERESKPWILKAARYAAILLLGLAIGYLASRPAFIGYYDATATKSKTLTPNAQKVISTLDSPLEITTYVNLLDKNFGRGEPSQRNADIKRWAPYVRFKPDIKLKYVYYYDSTFDKDFYKYNPGKSIKEIAERYAKVFKMDIHSFKTPAEMHKQIDLRSEGNTYVMQLKYKGRTTFLRLFNDFFVYPSETEVSAAIKRLTVPLPKIDFLSGDLERSPQKIGDRDYEILAKEKPFRYAFINQGFDVDTVSLSSNTNIPSGITTLVIADPKTAFTQAMLNGLQSYINSGGNLMIMGEPGKQSILNPLLKTIGVQLLDGQLVQQSPEYAPNLVLPYLTSNAAGVSKSLQRVFEDSVRVSMSGVSALSYSDTSGFKVSPLLMTDSSHSWLKKGNFALDSAAITYNPKQGDVKGKFPTAIALTRNINGKEQRIIVSGDADMMSNAELSRTNIRTANFQFSTALFGWFTYGQFPIETTRPKSRDNHLALSDGGLAVLKIVFLWVLPGMLLIFGLVLLLRRKRK